jgi:hypothetical protein
MGQAGTMLEIFRIGQAGMLLLYITAGGRPRCSDGSFRLLLWPCTIFVVEGSTHFHRVEE